MLPTRTRSTLLFRGTLQPGAIQVLVAVPSTNTLLVKSSAVELAGHVAGSWLLGARSSGDGLPGWVVWRELQAGQLVDYWEGWFVLEPSDELLAFSPEGGTLSVFGTQLRA